MIFILTEKIMNGTVTMDIITTLMEAPTWEVAFEKLTKFPNWKLAEDLTQNDDFISYRIGMSCWGQLSKKSAKVM